jgi:hypothetical protein
MPRQSLQVLTVFVRGADLDPSTGPFPLVWCSTNLRKDQSVAIGVMANWHTTSVLNIGIQPNLNKFQFSKEHCLDLVTYAQQVASVGDLVPGRWMGFDDA